MVESRKGENPRTWFRADRVYREGEHWYIATRETITLGPYETHEEAARDAARLIEILSKAQTPVDAMIAIREFRDRPRS